MIKTTALALLGAMTMQATAAQAADTISFVSPTNSSVNGSPDGNTRTFTSGGLSVTASAWSLSNGVLQNGWLGQYTHGLGVTNQGEDGSANSHVIDNFGRDDFIVLIFNQAVNIRSAVLTPFTMNGSIDNDAWVSYGTAGAFDSSVLTALLTRDYNVSGTGSSASVTLNNGTQFGNVWLIGAANSLAGMTDANSDGFKLTSINVQTAVPEPGTWALMLFGFGGMGLAMRRQRRVAALPQVA